LRLWGFLPLRFTKREKQGDKFCINRHSPVGKAD
jgi:hypothetical protein